MAGQKVLIGNLDDLVDGLTQSATPLPVAGNVATTPGDSARVVNILTTTTTLNTAVTRNSAAGTGIAQLGLLRKYELATFQLNVTAAAAGATDTLDVFIDLSLDGNLWINALHFTQVLGNGGAKTFVNQLCFPTAAVADINVTSDGAANSARNLWAPHVRAGFVQVSGGGTAQFTFQVLAALQAF